MFDSQDSDEHWQLDSADSEPTRTSRPVKGADPVACGGPIDPLSLCALGAPNLALLAAIRAGNPGAK